MFLLTCAMKILAYILYSINVSAFFPLVGRLLSGVSGGGIAIIFGQIAISKDIEARKEVFGYFESMYNVGTIIGSGLASVVTFRVAIFGWQIEKGNSPGIIVAIAWTLFFILAIQLPKDIWLGHKEMVSALNEDIQRRSSDSDSPSVSEYETEDKRKISHEQPNGQRRFSEDDIEDEPKIEWNLRVSCLLYHILLNEILSVTTIFIVPILVLDYFHLQLIHVTLLLLNSTTFATLIFILFSLASSRVDERKLFMVSLVIQIAGISLLSSIAFSNWNHITNVQIYILLLFVCIGRPYFAYPFSNSIVAKITNPRNAAFFQGLTLAAMHSGIIISRVVGSFVLTKEGMKAFCLVLMFFWFIGCIWYGLHYKQFVASNKEGKY